MTRLVLLLSVVLLVSNCSPPAHAESHFPVFEECSATAPAGTNYMLPGRAGERLDGADGSLDMTVLVWMACPGGPCVGLPFQDIYIDAAPGSTLAFCPSGNSAHANTNRDGQTSFSYPLSGGGWAEGGVRVWWAGFELPATVLEGFRLNSADINGDLVVDLADFGIFGADYSTGYRFRSDLVADGQLDIADFGRFGTSFGAACD